MKAVIRTFTRQYTPAPANIACHYVSAQSIRSSSSLTLSQSAETTRPASDNTDSSGLSLPEPTRSTRKHLSFSRVERVIRRGEFANACEYILKRTTRHGLSLHPRKRAIVLEAFELLLEHSADNEARALQRAFFSDAKASLPQDQEGYYGLLFLCVEELAPDNRMSERQLADWRVRAHRRILNRAQPHLRDITAQQLARALDRLLRVRDAGAPLCIALVGAFTRLHGEGSVSRDLGIQIARAASSALMAQSETEFRQSMRPFPGAQEFMRGDQAPMPWATRATQALQRVSRLEQNLADAHHARHLRALYEERAKGKGPLEPVTFTLDELVRPNSDNSDAQELSELQLALIAEGARMSLLVHAASQREDGARASPSDWMTFRNIGARLAAFSRPDFEQMSEAELNDLIARQEQYMKIRPLFLTKPSTETEAGEAKAPSDGSTTSPDASARAPEGGLDPRVVAEPVQAVGSTAVLLDRDDKAVLKEGQRHTATTSGQSYDSLPQQGSFEAELRRYAGLLNVDLAEDDIDMDFLGQRLVDKAVAMRRDFENGIADQSGLDEVVALIERYKELQTAAEVLASQQSNLSDRLTFDEVVQRLHDAATPPSTETDNSSASIRSGVSTLTATTTFLAEVARHGDLKPAHITAALATMSSKGIQPDARFFTVLITASVRAGDVARAHALYDAMQRSSQSDPRLIPTSVTYASLFKAAELPQQTRNAHSDLRNLFLPTQAVEGIRTPRVLFREMIDHHDRVTRGMRAHRMGSPAPDLPSIAIITRDSMHIALRAFLSTGDLPGALGVLHAYKSLHLQPRHRTYNIVFRELVVHIRRDVGRPRSAAGPISSRWSSRFIGANVKDMDEYQLMRHMYHIAHPGGPGNDPGKVPTLRMVRGAQRLARGARWDVSSLEVLLERAVYTGMEPKPGLETLTREVAKEEGERARREMIPPLPKPDGEMRSKHRVMRAWRSAKLREKRERERTENEGEEGDAPREQGDWEF